MVVILAIRHSQELVNTVFTKHSEGSVKLGMTEDNGTDLSLPESADDAAVAFRRTCCKLVPVAVDPPTYPNTRKPVDGSTWCSPK